MADIALLQMLQGYLQVTNERQQLIVSNMANVDTPGYQTKDVDFRHALLDLTEGTNSVESNAAVDVPGLPERTDGNNVNIDRESLLLAQTQLQYQIGIQLVKEEFHKLLTAIKEQ